jgi:hypothetical protein
MEKTPNQSPPQVKTYTPVFPHTHYPISADTLATISMSSLCIGYTIPVDMLIMQFPRSLSRVNENITFVKDVIKGLHLLLHLRDRMAELGPVTTCLELCPSKDHPDVIQAYRVWVFAPDDMQLGALVTELIQENAKEYRVAKAKGPSFVKRWKHGNGVSMEHRIMNVDQLIKFFSVYLSTNLMNPVISTKIKNQDLDLPSNPLYMQRIFGIQAIVCNRNTTLERSCKALANYCDMNNGDKAREVYRGYKFPHTHTVYHIPHQYCTIEGILRMELPTVMDGPAAVLLPDPIRNMYLKDIAVGPDGDSMDFGINNYLDDISETDLYVDIYGPESHKMGFDFTQTMIESNHETRLKLWEQMRKELDGGQDQQTSFDRYRLQMQKFFKSTIKQFASYWNEHNPLLSPAFRSMVKWAEDYKYNHQGSLYHPIQKHSRNLSLWNDWYIQTLLQMELLFESFACHHTVIVALTSVFNATDNNRKEKFHVISIGKQSTSKSFVYHLIEDLCIPGTVKSYTYKTSKSDTAPGNYDGLVEIFHEALNTWLGAGPVATKSSTPASTEAEAIFKERLTSGRVCMRELLRDDDGNRTSKENVRMCNGTFLMNTNLNLHNISPPILDRFVVIMATESVREDKTISSVVLQDPTNDTQLSRKHAVTRCQWIQYMVALVNQLIYFGIFAPVKTSYTNKMLDMILTEASRLGLPNSDNMRTIARVKAAVRAHTIVRAVLLHFGSTMAVNAPLHVDSTDSQNHDNPDDSSDESCGVPFEWDQLYRLQGDLVDSDPSILIGVLGMMKRQFESPLQYDVVAALEHHLFSSSPDEGVLSVMNSHLVDINDEDLSQEEKRKRRLEPYLYGDVDYPDFYYWRSNYFSESVIKSNSQMHTLAWNLQGVMRPKPRVSDITHQLQQLRDLQFPVTDTHSSVCCPAIEINGRDLLIARHLIHQNVPNKLKMAIKNVMEYDSAHTQTYVFGETPSNGRPYEVDLLTIKPRSDKQFKLPAQVGCSEYDKKTAYMFAKPTAYQNFDNIGTAPYERIMEDYPLEEHLYAMKHLTMGINEQDREEMNLLPEFYIRNRLVEQASTDVKVYPWNSSHPVTKKRVRSAPRAFRDRNYVTDHEDKPHLAAMFKF